MKRSRTRKRRRNAGPMLAGCLVLALSAAIPFAMKKMHLRMPEMPETSMRVKELYVSGLEELKRLDVESIVGVRKGDSMYGSWAPASISKLSLNPRVENAVVARSLTGEVFVKINERKSAALVNADRLYFVDAQGNILGAADEHSLAQTDLVVLTGPWSGKKWAEAWKGQVREGIALRQAALSSGIPEKEISEIHLDATRGWEMFRVGVTARILVGKGDFSTKASRLVRVLGDFRGKEGTLKEIDLDFDDRVVVKLIGAS